MGYSPLGGSSDRAPEAHGTTLLEHPTVNAIAKDANKTPGQVLIRWALQRGVISIPKSSNPDRLAQNFATLDWDLPDTAMEQLADLESDFRSVTCSPVADSGHKNVSSLKTYSVSVWGAFGANCARTLADIRYFISYLKKPDNNERWHDGKIEQGSDADWVGDNRDGAADWI